MKIHQTRWNKNRIQNEVVGGHKKNIERSNEFRFCFVQMLRMLLQHMQNVLVLCIFLGWEFCSDTLQLSLCFTLGEVTHLVVLWGYFQQPRERKQANISHKNCPLCLLVGQCRSCLFKRWLPVQLQQIWYVIVRGHSGGRGTQSRVCGAYEPTAVRLAS